MHPCCGGSLQKGTKVIATLSMVIHIGFIILGVLGIIGLGLLTSGGGASDTSVRQTQLSDTGILVLKGLISTTVISFVGFLLNILLLVGANKRNWTMCKVWLIVNAIGTVVIILYLFVDFSPGLTVLNGVKCGGILLQFYSMWVVWAFMFELKQEQGLAVTPPA